MGALGWLVAGAFATLAAPAASDSPDRSETQLCLRCMPLNESQWQVQCKHRLEEAVARHPIFGKARVKLLVFREETRIFLEEEPRPLFFALNAFDSQRESGRASKEWEANEEEGDQTLSRQAHGRAAGITFLTPEKDKEQFTAALDDLKQALELCLSLPAWSRTGPTAELDEAGFRLGQLRYLWDEFEGADDDEDATHPLRPYLASELKRLQADLWKLRAQLSDRAGDGGLADPSLENRMQTLEESLAALLQEFSQAPASFDAPAASIEAKIDRLLQQNKCRSAHAGIRQLRRDFPQELVAIDRELFDLAQCYQAAEHRFKASNTYFQLYRDYKHGAHAARAYLNSGAIYEEIGDPPSAEHDYQALIKSHPESPEAREARARLKAIKARSAR